MNQNPKDQNRDPQQDSDRGQAGTGQPDRPQQDRQQDRSMDQDGSRQGNQAGQQDRQQQGGQRRDH